MGKKYTTRKINLDFQIDDDVFKLREVIPAGVLFEFSNIQSRMVEATQSTGTSVADVILDAFSKILDDESFELFNARFFGAAPVPIDFITFQEVTEDILTDIAGKATQSKSSSSNDG